MSKIDELFYKNGKVRVEPSVPESKTDNFTDYDPELVEGECVCGKQHCPDEFSHWSRGFQHEWY